MTLSTRYSPQEIEAKWYAHWMKKGYFHSEPDEREPYTIVIPPPNVTGVLHMGHMLDNTIQDILIRKARLDGKNACWVPGMDHASIATEAKVVKLLREKGIKKSDLTREEFLEHAYAWKEKYGGIILDQLKQMGASCDWDRTRFTMEPKMSKAVLHVFVDLYKKGKIYRGLRMTNWDPEAQTVLSNEEVLYSEENAQLFHLRYDFEDRSGEGIVIATQRPETIMADVAVAVNPSDECYKDLIGKNVLVPLINRPIPVIADEYVTMDFGSGALKITPAHDPNDYDIGQKHGLEVIDILDPQGRLNEQAQILVGEDRFVARKMIKKMLEESGNLIQLEDYKTKIGRSERTGSVVEPRLTLQWFVDMKEFAQMALKAVDSGEIRFFPSHFWNMYYSWLREENVRDWCISRQLWWGHRIPAWFLESETFGEETQIFVAETEEEALDQARNATGNKKLTVDDLRQDEDVLDTWFSSWLWPISVFDGFETQEELKYYYPTNTLVTGWDIMFLWVARMIISGYEWSEELLGKKVVEEKGRQPFRAVYFHGMVRDNQRRKMSKSLGNSPDAVALMEKYGADGVRFSMMSSAPAGNDIIFDAPIDPKTKTVKNESKLCEQGRNFCNKMWNALRLIKGWSVVEKAPSEVNRLAVEWMDQRIKQEVAELEGLFEDFRLSYAQMRLYKLIWDDFCSWYLEMIKPEYGEPIDQATLEATIDLYERLMTLLHPFMPFVTEEIWQQLRERADGEDCVVSRWPGKSSFNEVLISEVQSAQNLVSGIREVRNSKGIKNQEKLRVFAEEHPATAAMMSEKGLTDLVIKMAGLEALEMANGEMANSVSFLSGTQKFYVELNEAIDTAAECEKVKKDLEYYEGFVQSVQKKLSNDKFVNGAPEAVVNKERQKLADGEAKVKSLREALEQLGC